MRISWDFWLWNLTPSIFPTIFMGRKNWKIHGNIMSRGQKFTPVSLWLCHSWSSHSKWWFSIAMLVYQRVPSGFIHGFLWKIITKIIGKNHPLTGNSPLGNPHEITTSSTMVCPYLSQYSISLLLKAPFLMSFPDDDHQTHPLSIYHHININHNSLIMPTIFPIVSRYFPPQNLRLYPYTVGLPRYLLV